MWWFSSKPFSNWHSKEAQGQTMLQPLYSLKDALPIAQASWSEHHGKSNHHLDYIPGPSSP